MINNFKVEIDDSSKIKKIKKSNLIIRLSIIGVFLLTVLITAIVIFAGGEKRTVFLGGDDGTRLINSKKYVYTQITLAELKDDDSIETIYAKDFKAVVDGKEYECAFIETGVHDRLLEYKLVHNGKSQYVYIYFEMNKSKDVEYFYKDKALCNYSSYANKDGDFIETLFIEFIVFAVAFAIVNTKLTARTYAKNGEKYKAVNEKVMLKLKEENFNLTKTFALSGKRSGSTEIEKMLVFVDGKNKKFAFVDYDKKLFKIVDYKDLINYKLIEKNGTDIDSHLHYSIILDSAYTTTSSRDVCKKLQLVFVLNDEEDSTIIYELVKSSIGMDTKRYKNLSKEMIELTAFLDIVEKNTQKDKKFIYCKHCGTKNDYDAKKCSSCGAAID